MPSCSLCHLDAESNRGSRSQSHAPGERLPKLLIDQQYPHSLLCDGKMHLYCVRPKFWILEPTANINYSDYCTSLRKNWAWRGALWLGLEWTAPSAPRLTPLLSHMDWSACPFMCSSVLPVRHKSSVLWGSRRVGGVCSSVLGFLTALHASPGSKVPSAGVPATALSAPFPVKTGHHANCGVVKIQKPHPSL